MQSTAVETTLHMDDFIKYFEAVRLGKLYFPNGKAYNPDHQSHTDFYINLRDLYKLVTGWRVNSTLVPLDDIVAIIAFGSAVHHPGFLEVTRNRLFRGPVTKQVPIQPSDADFLVITGENLIREEFFEPTLRHFYGGSCIERGGIHLVNRGVSQLLNGVQANDTVSVSALREGVPIFFSRRRLEGVVAQAGVVMTTPRKILWDENAKGFLTGRIR